jgi:hypothetical protein
MMIISSFTPTTYFTRIERQCGDLAEKRESYYLPRDFCPSSCFFSDIPKADEKEFSEYGLYITKTVYYEVSCGVVVGWVLKAAEVRGSDPAGTLCELPPKS